ncbi:MAG: hypothetical protein OEX08_00920 [Candidatus Nomurabacteria bacterium]|nr:hypothetical protein [Candidatus Nomurabacteria bacterium]
MESKKQNLFKRNNKILVPVILFLSQWLTIFMILAVTSSGDILKVNLFTLVVTSLYGALVITAGFLYVNKNEKSYI